MSAGDPRDADQGPTLYLMRTGEGAELAGGGAAGEVPPGWLPTGCVAGDELALVRVQPCEGCGESRPTHGGQCAACWERALDMAECDIARWRDEAEAWRERARRWR